MDSYLNPSYPLGFHRMMELIVLLCPLQEKKKKMGEGLSPKRLPPQLSIKNTPSHDYFQNEMKVHILAMRKDLGAVY